MNKKLKYYIIAVLFCIFFFVSETEAQNYKLTAKSNKYNYSIGELITVKIFAEFPKEWNIVLPEIKNNIPTEFELRRTLHIKKEVNEKRQIYSAELEAICFKAGKYSFPELIFIVEKPEFRNVSAVKSQAFTIIVSNAEIASDSVIKDIVFPIANSEKTNKTNSKLFLYIGFGSILICLVIALYFFRKRFDRKVYSKKITTPYEINKHIQEMRIADLTDLVFIFDLLRDLIELVFQTPINSKKEFIQIFKLHSNEFKIEEIDLLFEKLELIKFAKIEVGASEIEMNSIFIKNISNFVMKFNKENANIRSKN